MKRWLLALALMLAALTGPACGQGIRLPDASDRFAWSPPARPYANAFSWATVATQLTFDLVDAVKAENRRERVWEFTCAHVSTQAATFGLKRVFHQRRPDGSDDQGFPSGHTASAAAGMGWSYGAGLSLTLGTAGLRVGAGKHDWLEVGAGAGLGLGLSKLCSALIK